MDGLTFVQKLRASPAYKFTPMLMLTTEAGADFKAKGKAAGLTGWLVKPFDPQKLLASSKKFSDKQAVEKQPVEPMDGRPKSRTGLQVLDFVSKTEIVFSACVIEKAPDGTFHSPAKQATREESCLSWKAKRFKAVTVQLTSC